MTLSYKPKSNSEQIRKYQRRNIWSNMVGSIFSGFGDSCINIAYIPFLYQVTNQNLILVGLFSTFYQIMAFFPSPITGKLSDKFGRKKMNIISTPIAIVGTSLLLFVHEANIYIVFLSILLRAVGFMSSGINYQLILSASSSASECSESKEETSGIEGKTKDKKKKQNRLGQIYSIIVFIYFISTLGGSYFVNQTGYAYKVYFGIFTVSVIINWVMNIVFITDIEKIKKENPDNPVNLPNCIEEKNCDKHMKKNSWLKLFRNPKIKSAILVLTLDIFFWGIAMSILNAGMQDQYGLSLEDLAYYNMIFNISNMVFQIPGGKLTDKLGKKKILIISESTGLIIFSLHIIASLCWSAGNTAMLVPLMILINIFFGITVSTFVSSEMMILTNLDDKRKGESYGIVSFIRGIGAMPTGIIGGFLMASIGFIAPFVVTLIGIVIIILYLIRYGHRFEDEPKSEVKEKSKQQNIQQEIEIMSNSKKTPRSIEAEIET